MARVYEEERACNSIDIEILGVTKNRFQIAFPVEQSIRALKRIMRYSPTLRWEKLLLQTLAQDAVYSAPPCTCSIIHLHCDGRSFSYKLWHRMQYTVHLPAHAVYRAVHLWWRTMLGTTGASATAADDEQHLTVMNGLASISIGTYVL